MPEMDAAVLMGHVTGEDAGRTLLADDCALAAEQESRYRDLIAQRCLRMPVSQLTGSREFYSLDFEIVPGVLTPRPETETLVEEAVRFMVRIDGPPRVLDIGTGSGAIAVTLAVTVPRCEVVAVDISPTAVRAADRNARRHGVRHRVAILRGDLAEGLAEGERFDLIVSNPPYIRDDDFEGLPPEVRNGDPRMGLLAGPEGLEFYRPIARQGQRLLKPDGSLMVEVGAGQARRVEGIMAREGYGSLRIIKDLAGRGRVVVGRKAVA